MNTWTRYRTPASTPCKVLVVVSKEHVLHLQNPALGVPQRSRRRIESLRTIAGTVQEFNGRTWVVFPEADQHGVLLDELHTLWENLLVEAHVTDGHGNSKEMFDD